MLQDWLQQLRFRLSTPEAALPYAMLGIAAGIVSSVVIIAFRELLYWPLSQWLPGGNPENFEGLARHWHFALPLAGALLVGIVLSLRPSHQRRVGITHVISNIHQGEGMLPWRNAVVQFVTSIIALASGQSGGREGPAVHLGAASSSLLGQRLDLPNNSLRVLAACGCAAGIAASFNTPIAGVIFAMEVVMMEYTVTGFVPVILAAVTATAVNQLWHGNEIFFDAPTVQMQSLLELPFIALIGFACGLLSAGFVRVQSVCLGQQQRPVILRMLLAGLATGCAALLTPQIMGTGYDSLADTLNNELPFALLLILIASKLLTTAISCGLGMPIGIIGPSILIGAFSGAAIGTVGTELFPHLASGHSLYVMIGMGAMMGAILNAPLAALMALVELTHNLELIFPAMLAITVAQLTHRELFGLRSSHQTTLQAMQEQLRTDPLSMALLRTSVMAVMDRDLEILEQHITFKRAHELLNQPCNWLLVKNPDGKYIAIERKDWATRLNDLLQQQDNELSTTVDIDLLDILDNKLRTTHFDIGGTLRQALDLMNRDGLDTLFVRGSLGAKGGFKSGIVTRKRIEQHYNTPMSF